MPCFCGEGRDDATLALPTSSTEPFFPPPSTVSGQGWCVGSYMWCSAEHLLYDKGETGPRSAWMQTALSLLWFGSLLPRDNILLYSRQGPKNTWAASLLAMLVHQEWSNKSWMGHMLATHLYLAAGKRMSSKSSCSISIKEVFSECLITSTCTILVYRKINLL